MLAANTVHLTKTFTSSFGRKVVTAVDDLSIEVEEGSIYGVLGRNGAGKTTLVKMLLGIVHPTSGTSALFGRNVFKEYQVKRLVGYLPENHRFPSFLTARQALSYFGQMAGMKDRKQLNNRIAELLEVVKMTQWADRRMKTYSKGMMQRIGLAQAMLNDPDLLFLDEPTDGVDPLGRKEIRDILIQIRDLGKTIILNSHLLSEVEMVTDRVAILNRGKLIKEGTVRELTTEGEDYRLLLGSDPSETLASEVKKQFKLRPAPKEEGAWMVSVPDWRQINDLIDHLREKDVLIREVSHVRNSLEDIFISLLNEAEGEETK